MDSRLFIRAATQLVTDIVDGVKSGDATFLQKEVSRLFVGLQNPTLPSALRLRDVALKAGLSISPQVLQRLHQGETVWSFGI